MLNNMTDKQIAEEYTKEFNSISDRLTVLLDKNLKVGLLNSIIDICNKHNRLSIDTLHDFEIQLIMEIEFLKKDKNLNIEFKNELISIMDEMQKLIVDYMINNIASGLNF
jgi:hypothetical protein